MRENGRGSLGAEAIGRRKKNARENGGWPCV